MNAPVQYGPGVRSVATYLVNAQHLPVARTARTLSDLLGAPVSTGTVAAIVAQAASGLGPFTRAVREQLAGSEVAHFDETGLRVDGKLAWVHSASTARLTQVTVHPRRRIEAMDSAAVLPDFDGIAVHDGWKPYRHYDRNPATGRGVLHGLRNAHHLRELTAVTVTDTALAAAVTVTATRAAEDGQGWDGAGQALTGDGHAVRRFLALPVGSDTISGLQRDPEDHRLARATVRAGALGP